MSYNNKLKSWNLDTTWRCTLKCSQCTRTEHINTNRPMPKTDMTIEQFKKVVDYTEGKVMLHMCGTWGDPVFNPSFLSMLKYAYQKGAPVSISNAASHQPESFYDKAFAINPDAEWWFGIDGLPKESHKYRVNQDGVKLYKIMCKAHSNGIKVVWQYIVFDYNKKQIKLVEKICREKKINLVLIDTKRKP